MEKKLSELELETIAGGDSIAASVVADMTVNEMASAEVDLTGPVVL